jgi:hypothetical protein
MLHRMKRSRAPLLPHLAPPLRWALGMGLLGLCLWLPSVAALFR